MPNEIIHSGRFFQLWRYSVSHGELLLRSTKTADRPARIDMFFKGVTEIHLPKTANGLFVKEASEADIQNLSILRPPRFDHGDRVFRIEGPDFVGYVVALLALCHEDDGEYFDPSFFDSGSSL